MEKYFLKDAMVPDFFPPGLAKRILDVGKTVDFLRRICRVQEPFMDHLARAQPLVNLPMRQGALCDTVTLPGDAKTKELTCHPFFSSRF